MNKLVGMVHRILGKSKEASFRLPYAVGLMIGKGLRLGRSSHWKMLAISSIRVKNSVQIQCLTLTGFVAPVPLVEALESIMRHEFVESHENKLAFFSE